CLSFYFIQFNESFHLFLFLCIAQFYTILIAAKNLKISSGCPYHRFYLRAIASHFAIVNTIVVRNDQEFIMMFIFIILNSSHCTCLSAKFFICFTVKILCLLIAN